MSEDLHNESDSSNHRETNRERGERQDRQFRSNDDQLELLKTQLDFLKIKLDRIYVLLAGDDNFGQHGLTHTIESQGKRIARLEWIFGYFAAIFTLAAVVYKILTDWIVRR